MSYISFDKLDEFDVINAYSKKPLDFNFHVLSRKEIDKSLNYLEDEIGYQFDKVVIPKQSHTTNVVFIDEDNVDDEFVDVDGVFTNVKGIGLGTVSADCQTILVYDIGKEVVGSVHSGWRGTYNGIIVKAIKEMIDHYNSNVEDIYVCICPSILQCCFEVDEDVKDMFLDKYGDKYIKKGAIKDDKQKYNIDTVKINIDELNKIGVNNVMVPEICVCCGNEDFYSYRADGKDTGRNIGLIGMKK